MPLRLSLFALALLALAVAAFWPGYLSKLGAANRYTHVHAALGTGWLLLLVAQPLLIRASLRSWHRVLGRIGVLVGATFFVSGILVAHHSVARLDAEAFAREGVFVYLPLAMAAIFAVALALAVVWRRTPALHGRFMAATALPLLDPLFARLLFRYAPPLPDESLYQVPAFALSTAILATLYASLPATVRDRPTFACFALGATAIFAGYFVVPSTSAWQAFATWFRALPIG